MLLIRPENRQRGCCAVVQSKDQGKFCRMAGCNQLHQRSILRLSGLIFFKDKALQPTSLFKKYRSIQWSVNNYITGSFINHDG